MKLSLAKTEDRAPSYDEESNIFQPLALQIVTPEGTTITMQVTTGDTISIIKKRLEVEHSIAYKETVLTLNDKVMIEPLSLNDFADLPAVDPVIVCKVLDKP
ncbi:uncharacterized protein ACA1_384020 [Acanthamoeba castellanii str. Neff]|uniref:Ubiquitin-like domain-containing protein n=1 Tax=Acanthamoeba castellanii (strain ATCC 30010 / Neff) TaxID=1257118 RepID=L8H872_ACACF|nr:uncharacterized protein ACA1_384020 [Acanthamoeba castellanii str. Neff]ELR21699.1 hypothetical protein ACA1_384020 [Acanthamoeba castellanii str. Neff]